MAHTYKMVFLDLDGTTLTSDKKITLRTSRVLEKLDRSGIPVVITTGRSIYSVRNFYSDLAITSPVITLNGSVVYSQINGSLQSYKQIPEDIIHELIGLFHDRDGIDNYIFEGIHDYFVRKSDQELQQYFIKIRKKQPIVMENNHRLTNPITNLLVRPVDKKDEIHQWLQEQTNGRIHFVNTEWNWIEGMNPGVHKGSAIKEMAERYGIALEQVVAFGDEWNDIEMLQAAGLGVAMENGSEAAKCVANFIAPSNDREGVATVLEEIFAEHLADSRTVATISYNKKSLPL